MIEYAVIESDIDQRFERFESATDRDAAEACAKDFYENHDGWEHNWENNALTFVLFDDDKEVARWNVGLDFWPSFSASEVES